MTLGRFQDYNFNPKDPNKKIETLPVTQISKEMAQKLYFAMVRLRRAQESLIEEYHPADEMKCPVHFCVGQEAVPAALSQILQPEDYLFSHHRSHGYYTAKVPSLKPLFAELYGRETGANGGKAGSQDVSMTEHRFFSGAILAGTIPIAAGTALTFKYKGLPHVAVAGTGEAATEEGIYWETLNYAATQNLPVLFMVENNFYSTFSPQDKRTLGCNIAERARAFGIRTETFFGNDVVKVYTQVEQAIRSLRENQGPVLIETFTYRWNGHVGPEDDDFNNYRTPEEIAYWKRHCPIALLEKRMMEAGYLSPELKEKMEADIRQEILEAFTFAKQSPFPKALELDSANLSGVSPVADRVLCEESQVSFNQHQVEAIPGPY